MLLINLICFYVFSSSSPFFNFTSTQATYLSTHATTFDRAYNATVVISNHATIHPTIKPTYRPTFASTYKAAYLTTFTGTDASTDGKINVLVSLFLFVRSLSCCFLFVSNIPCDIIPT